jgi:hypothetical protein
MREHIFNGPEKQSVVSTRFKPEETDKLVKP